MKWKVSNYFYKNCLLIFFVMLLLVSCHQEPDIEVSFNEVILKKINNTKAIRVQIKNNSPSGLFIPSLIIIENLGIKHPCLDKMFGNYSKISSHNENDCQVNRGIMLFTYLQTIPSNLTSHSKLRNNVLSAGHFDAMFYYLDPKLAELKISPEITFVGANSSTYIYFKVSEPLKSIDMGEYKLDWLPKKIFDQNISIKKIRCH